MESVIITLKSTQQGRENEAEETELDTLGTCQRKDGVLELSYEDSEVTGFVGSTTMVRVEQSDTGMLVNVMRSGTANSNLILEIGKKHFSVYNTPYGNMALGIETERIREIEEKNLRRFMLHRKEWIEKWRIVSERQQTSCMSC